MSNSFDYPKDYDVYWEKWVDAYQNEIDGVDEINRAIESLEDMEEFGELDDFEYEDIDPEIMKKLDEMSGLSSMKTIMTPFGMMPLTEQCLASNHFKFWVGHTNFKLLKSYTKIIGSTEGVESIDILTPYRFRIAVGKLFSDRDVMSKVRKALLEIV
tara:strand:- start:2362 stop:2832 length:471 start_codon:yes stop_codon:yes gene_type:complete